MTGGFSLRSALVGTVWIACVAASAAAQDSTSPGSLGDVARRSRAQHAAEDSKSSKAQALVDEMQQEQEAAENAPVGFKSYNAGDYRLFVPFPFSLEGRDNGGAVLVGSRLGITNTEVLAGVPIPIPSNLSDTDLANTIRQLAQRYSQSASCSVVKTGPRKAFRCGLSKGYLLGHEVWGTMEFVVGSANVIPVMCVSPDEINQCVTYDSYGYHTCNKRYPSWEEVQRANKAIQTRYQDQRTTAQVCDQIIYPSIQLKEDVVVHPANISDSKAQTSSAVVPVQNATLPESTSHTPSLAELARQSRQAPHSKAHAILDNAEGGTVAPAGFESFTLQYCQNPQQCSEASIIVPEKSEVVSRINGQHIFKTTLNGDPVMLYAGPADVNAPYRSMTDPDYIRIRDLGNMNGWSREKVEGVSTQELTIDGRAALMTRFRYQRDRTIWWIGERAVIDMRTSPYETKGAQFLIGCTAPEQRFADAEALCTTLVNSLQLQ